MFKIFHIILIFSLQLSDSFSKEDLKNHFAYKIENIDVQATAESANQAQKQAIQEGSLRAFQALLDNFSLKEGVELPDSHRKDIPDLVENYQVRNEKLSRTRYSATLDFYFSPHLVETYIQEKLNIHTPLLPKKSSLNVLVPVFINSQDQLLWDSYNPWLRVWGDLLDKNYGQNFLLPMGDLRDLSDMTVGDAVDHNPEAFRKIIFRYRAQGALLVIATEVPHSQKYKIFVMLVTPDQNFIPIKLPDHLRETSDINPRYTNDLAHFLSQEPPHHDTEAVAEALDITTSVFDLNDWISLKEKLGNLAFIENITIKKVQKEKITFHLTVSGALEDFRQYLKETWGYNLTPTQENAWVLDRTPQL